MSRPEDNITGTPDLAVVRDKTAIFCDGDFWHGKGWKHRKAKLRRGSNPEYWGAKIGRNIERDGEVDRALAEAGWDVVRVWESEVKKDAASVARRIKRLLGR